jgi:hypothetical protein
VCNTMGYVNCLYYAKKMGEAKCPFDWLTHIATQQGLSFDED